ncbi:winged helix-turn-helix transcriptional regulator [Streptosporangium sp. NBC_01469]|uniref:winged helix-turn-helix transcriptional regulator n=1 Tax=Streptosporangium sp. NBC_01469 TaxID=2903898 RepID=UPI002E2D3C28|nr:helix-turn-helix domain-containing protein [Streptosporangium sp. NBC_01469]
MDAMRRTRFDNWPCSIARTVDLVGDWWTPLVMREAFYGARRFEEFQQRLGVSRNVLTQRLDRLVDEDMLTRLPYQERPTRHEYRLTDKGRDFFTVLAAMIRWGDRWLTDPDGPPVELRDRETGLPVEIEVIDTRTGRPIDVRQVIPTPGPGLPQDLAEQLLDRHRRR